jgi:release factor glutamine methyltransferase
MDGWVDRDSMTSDNITVTAKFSIGGLLERGVQRLRTSVAATGPGATPNLDAEWLLTHAIGFGRARLRSHPEDPVEKNAAELYMRLIERRASGEPLAYVIGRKDFWSLRLTVTPAVLVPRPETELLVERALALRPDEYGQVVDLGTGSGAIALTLASERPGWQVVATDMSEEALAVARLNANALNLSRVRFLKGSWLEPLAGHTFDLIVSNPPYVPADDPAMSDPALLHEPRGALTPGADGLACLRAIIEAAPDYLERDGWLLLEHGADQAAEVARELVARGLRHVRSHRDLAGHERMTEAQRA